MKETHVTAVHSTKAYFRHRASGAPDDVLSEAERRPESVEGVENA